MDKPKKCEKCCGPIIMGWCPCGAYHLDSNFKEIKQAYCPKCRKYYSTYTDCPTCIREAARQREAELLKKLKMKGGVDDN